MQELECMSTYVSGFAIGASLIIAIGAQNAFILTQAIRREHHILLASVCTLIDALLIAAGVVGIGQFIATTPLLHKATSIGGMLFLLWFGCRSLAEAKKTQGMTAAIAPSLPKKKTALLTLLGVTLLNPHVYLDTVVMLGALSANYQGYGRYIFALGAITASACWFFGLAFCGAKLAPFFATARAWRILYTLVAIMVFSVAFSLGQHVFYELFLQS